MTHAAGGGGGGGDRVGVGVVVRLWVGYTGRGEARGSRELCACVRGIDVMLLCYVDAATAATASGP